MPWLYLDVECVIVKESLKKILCLCGAVSLQLKSVQGIAVLYKYDESQFFFKTSNSLFPKLKIFTKKTSKKPIFLFGFLLTITTVYNINKLWIMTSSAIYTLEIFSFLNSTFKGYFKIVSYLCSVTNSCEDIII